MGFLLEKPGGGEQRSGHVPPSPPEFRSLYKAELNPRILSKGGRGVGAFKKTNDCDRGMNRALARWKTTLHNRGHITAQEEGFLSVFTSTSREQCSR